MSWIKNLEKELRRKYGKPKGQWTLWCKRPKSRKEREEVIIGAVLAQRVNWNNVELAINNLKKAKVNSLKDICKISEKELAFLIKPAGFYKTKARYLFNLSKFIFENYSGLQAMKKEKLEILREKLLKLKGIGPETADSILLYGLDKPIFVIDEYTRRIVKKQRAVKNFSYNFLQNLFEKELKKNFRIYQDFHALIVIDGKNKKWK